MIIKFLLVSTIIPFLSAVNCEELIGVRKPHFWNGITEGDMSHSRVKRNINSDLITIRIQELFDEMNEIKQQNERLHANYITTLENMVLKVEILSGKIEDIGNKINRLEANQEVIGEKINTKHDELIEKLDPLQLGHVEIEKNTTDAEFAGDYEKVSMEVLTYAPHSNISNFIEWQDSVIRNVNSYKISSMTTLSNLLQRKVDNAKEKMIRYCEGENVLEGVFNSCFSLQKHFPWLKNGIYRIFPSKKSDSKTVYCDMETYGGGWTAFQRRGYHLSKSFHRNWNEYSNGFGNAATEDYWLGLEAIHDMTKFCNHELMMTGTHKNGTLLYLTFSTFGVANSSLYYKLTLNDYQPSLSNFSSPNNYHHSGEIFSTLDKDNDQHSSNCASIFKSGWWYGACYVMNPNSTPNGNLGIQWVALAKSTFIHVDKTELKIRPRC